jgi:uncharacterized membrane protein
VTGILVSMLAAVALVIGGLALLRKKTEDSTRDVGRVRFVLGIGALVGALAICLLFMWALFVS